MTTTKHSPLPWVVRPHPYDDWGLIRASNGSVSCLARSPLYFNEDALRVHRKNKTDPTEANAQFIITACNSHYESLQTIKVLKDALECVFDQYKLFVDGEADEIARETTSIVCNALAKVKP